jgi:threonine aldolase
MTVEVPIDLRSDTVTKPTPEMRAAMAAAEVGDDVYGEDPTVNRLETLAAEKLGKEAGLFVPSGTMGNQIAIHIHVRPGQEVITEERGHVFNYEMAAMAAISGALARPIKAADGILSWPQIEAAIRPRIYYVSSTGLITLENTHNMAGGTCYTAEQVKDICDHAHAVGLPVHMDGARIFNASVALGSGPAVVCGPCDSVMFCLSKGLAAPIGSMLVGSRKFIERARSVRKMLGGGMRQAGVIAAAGIIALEKMPARLYEDHVRARLLADLLAQFPSLEVEPAKVQTNIVIVGVSRTGYGSGGLSGLLKTKGLLVGTVDATTIRLLTHLDVGNEQIYRAAGIFKEVLATASGA